jgi:hypothetical protein
MRMQLASKDRKKGTTMQESNGLLVKDERERGRKGDLEITGQQDL